jgi:2-C-methyl-D-erythritol 2,4-cyclodiphosphate synthase
MNFRTGFGYDVHAFAFNRKLMLGGIEVPFEKGLKGHSDADVLLHAICDALLGALALGDIGKHFPDTEPNFKGIDSKILLSKVNDLVIEKGYTVSNIDSTVVMERPKLKEYILPIRESIARILNISADQVSVKATTSEQLGFVGLEEGVKAFATVLIFANPEN